MSAYWPMFLNSVKKVVMVGCKIFAHRSDLVHQREFRRAGMNKKPAHARATELRSMNARVTRRFHKMQNLECFGHLIPLLNTAMPSRFAGVPEFPCTLSTSSVTATVLVAFTDRIYVSSIRQMISLCYAIPNGTVGFSDRDFRKISKYFCLGNDYRRQCSLACDFWRDLGLSLVI